VLIFCSFRTVFLFIYCTAFVLTNMFYFGAEMHLFFLSFMLSLFAYYWSTKICFLSSLERCTFVSIVKYASYRCYRTCHTVNRFTVVTAISFFKIFLYPGLKMILVINNFLDLFFILFIEEFGCRTVYTFNRRKQIFISFFYILFITMKILSKTKKVSFVRNYYF